MLNRRSVTIGSLAIAASALPHIGLAQGGRPILVFVGHEL